MPVTVRGTDILFNDGTTQNTAIAKGLGDGQSWTAITVANDTTYTNTTGRAVAVTVQANGTGSYGFNDSVYVNGVRIIYAYFDAAVAGMTYMFIVPPGQTYRVVFGTGVAGAWMLKT